MFWREHVAVTAERHISQTASLNSTAEAAATQIDLRLADLEGLIRAQLGDLENAVRAVVTAASQVDVPLQGALRRRDQAAADLFLKIADSIDASSTASIVAPSRVAQNGRSLKAAAKVKAGAACPKCEAAMTKRWASAAYGSGAVYYGCTAYPKCDGTRPAGPKRRSP